MSDRLVEAHARRVSEAAATMPAFRVSRDVATTDENELLDRLVPALHGSPLNAAWRDGAITAHEDVRVAIALDRVAPVLGDLDALRARDPESFTAAELAGATFTVVFALGVDAVEPLLVPRQAAVLGVGRSRLTLTCDARVVTVAQASAFLAGL